MVCNFGTSPVRTGVKVPFAIEEVPLYTEYRCVRWLVPSVCATARIKYISKVSLSTRGLVRCNRVLTLHQQCAQTDAIHHIINVVGNVLCDERALCLCRVRDTEHAKFSMAIWSSVMQQRLYYGCISDGLRACY